MTRKLEELFGFDKLESSEPIEDTKTTEETRSAIVEIDEAIDKIDTALPAVKGLEATDTEMDELADLAKRIPNPWREENDPDAILPLDINWLAPLLDQVGPFIETTDRKNRGQR